MVVLILVLLDDGLVQEFDFLDSANGFAVLILVLLDDGLVHLHASSRRAATYCLNPCFVGRWTST